MNAKVGSTRRVHDGQVEAVALADRLPVRRRGAAQGVGADADAGRADGVHVDDRREILDVGTDEVVGVGRGGPERPSRSATALHARVARGEERVGARLDRRASRRCRRGRRGEGCT